MYGLLFLFLLTFSFLPKSTYPDFLEEHFPSHSLVCGSHFTSKEGFACLKHSFFTSYCLDEKTLPLSTALACIPPERKIANCNDSTPQLAQQGNLHRKDYPYSEPMFCLV